MADAYGRHNFNWRAAESVHELVAKQELRRANGQWATGAAAGAQLAVVGLVVGQLSFGEPAAVLMVAVFPPSHVRQRRLRVAKLDAVV